MKSITEILGGCQMVFGISYDIQEIFEGYVTDEHRTFIQMLQVIEEFLPLCDRPDNLPGRKSYDGTAMIRSFLAKQFFKIPTVTSLRNRLLSDPSLRQICGFSTVPSEATFSRRYASHAQERLMERTLGPLVSSYLQDHIVGHVSRDSTAIEAREKATNRKKEGKPKGKRGRPKKGSEPRDKQQNVLERQLVQSAKQAVGELNSLCSWGCKRNSQGNNNYWKGYKLHLDVTDSGIPISAIVTGANVHDSQVAIPLERMTGGRIIHLYSLMDSAYDAKPIKDFIIGNGRIPIVDPNKRRKQQRVLSPAEKQRFKIRSTVERSNAHLKDWLIPSKIMVRGPDKVAHCLMTGVLCLAAIKILQYCILPDLQKTA
ncbi:MAG: transposase [Sphaerochaeta sp.]|jgi:transposase|uniref:transposase n=1 Tax=Sphaerochaeta sp. TaxID=1972642 RepID=UPI003D096DDE